MRECPIFKQAHMGPRQKPGFPWYPVPKIPDDFENLSVTDWIFKNISASGRVSGTRWSMSVDQWISEFGLKHRLVEKRGDVANMGRTVNQLTNKGICGNISFELIWWFQYSVDLVAGQYYSIPFPFHQIKSGDARSQCLLSFHADKSQTPRIPSFSSCGFSPKYCRKCWKIINLSKPKILLTFLCIPSSSVCCLFWTQANQ